MDTKARSSRKSDGVLRLARDLRHSYEVGVRAMQEAIWFLEGEISAASAAALDLITLAHNDMLSIGWTDAALGNVRVANLYRGPNFETSAQDMLVLVPEPGTLLLLGIGIGALTRFRPRRQAPRLH